MAKCPFKVNTTSYTRWDYPAQNQQEAVQTRKSFGDCDSAFCPAYYISRDAEGHVHEHCRLCEGAIKCT